MKRLAILVPVVAVLAISIHATTASGEGIAVDASLGGCKQVSRGIVCNIQASFTSVGGADYYTASVTGPDGAVQDLGSVPAGSVSVWPRYSGDGTYTITITAMDDGGQVKRGSASAGG
jgi:hypothetical protein